MLIHQFFNQLKVLECFNNLVLLGYVVAGHGDLHSVSFGTNLRIDLLEFLCCSFCFRLASFNSVFVLIETLSDWVGVADFGVVDEADVFDSPAYQIASQLTTQCTSSKE